MWVAPSRFGLFIIECSFAPRLTQLSQYLLIRSIVRSCAIVGVSRVSGTNDGIQIFGIFDLPSHLFLL